MLHLPQLQLPLALRQRATAAAADAQLLVLHGVIRGGRLARRVQHWAKPIRPYLWVLPASYGLGLLGGYILFVR